MLCLGELLLSAFHKLVSHETSHKNITCLLNLEFTFFVRSLCETKCYVPMITHSKQVATVTLLIYKKLQSRRHTTKKPNLNFNRCHVSNHSTPLPSQVKGEKKCLRPHKAKWLKKFVLLSFSFSSLQL